jgi:hypothetical protein
MMHQTEHRQPLSQTMAKKVASSSAIYVGAGTGRSCDRLLANGQVQACGVSPKKPHENHETSAIGILMLTDSGMTVAIALAGPSQV